MSARRVALVVAAVAVIAVIASACTAGGSGGASSAAPSTRTTIVGTRTSTVSAPSGSFTPQPAASVRPLRPGKNPRAGEVEKRCPYIHTGLNQDSDGYAESAPNVADIEGDRIYRTTVLTELKPVGCRFYFYAPPYEAVADILPQTFGSAAAAHDALVQTAKAGRNAKSYPDFVAGSSGIDGVNYQTRFFGPDGETDWAFAFAAGRVLVVVHTQQDNSPLNALYLARAIAAKF